MAWARRVEGFTAGLEAAFDRAVCVPLRIVLLLPFRLSFEERNGRDLPIVAQKSSLSWLAQRRRDGDTRIKLEHPGWLCVRVTCILC